MAQSPNLVQINIKEQAGKSIVIKILPQTTDNEGDGAPEDEIVARTGCQEKPKIVSSLVAICNS